MAVKSFDTGFAKGFGSNLSYATINIVTEANDYYEDGDIIHAFSRKDIRQHYAGKICHIRNTPQRKGQRRDVGTLTYKWLEKHSLYKFERISFDTIVRTNLITLEQEYFNNTPNANNERINVELFVQRRLQRDMHAIFGAAGAEIWFGELREPTHSDFDELWTEIEATTTHRESDRPDFPVTPLELCQGLWIRTNDFNDIQKSDLLSDISEFEPRKKYTVDWRSLRDASSIIFDILNKQRKIDIRLNRKHVWQDIVKTK